MNLARMTDNLVGQPMFQLKERIGELEAQGEKILHFEIGDSCFGVPQSVAQETISSIVGGNTHYANSTGIDELKIAIAKATQKEYGFTPNLKQILVMPANAIIDFVIRCVCDDQDEAIIPDPGFPTYASVLNYTGIKAVPVFSKALEIANRITDRTKLIIINSPSNPTGEVLDEREIAMIYNRAVENNLFLLSDEVYSRMIYDAVHFSPSQFDRCEKRVILLKSFSKLYSMAGFRLGYAIGPRDLIEKMGLLFQTIFSCMPVFIQKAGIKALEEDIKDRMNYYRECRDIIVKGLNEIEGISCPLPQGAFYVFPDIKKTGLTSKECARRMLENRGVAVLSGSDFGKNGEGYVRLCYATKKEIIKEALKRMKDA